MVSELIDNAYFVCDSPAAIIFAKVRLSHSLQY